MNGICKVGKRLFRYNRKHCVVEYITKATSEDRADNAEWQKKYGKDLWDIDAAGYIVLDSIGLRPENWDNKDSRTEYLNEWAYELGVEGAQLLADAIKEFC